MVKKERSLKNLELLCNNFEVLNKCSTQIRPQTAINSFIQQVSDSGSAKVIKDKITGESIKIIKDNPLLSNFLEVVKDLEYLPFDIDSEIDLILTVIQIVEVIKKDGSNIKKVRTYLEYVEYRRDIDQKLDAFNTTGRTIKTKETKNRLVVEFLSANKMSNGERDVLSFISNLSKFKVKFKKDIGIFIIDEIFDYLDGSNMLIVQYYLSKMIEDCKHLGKVLFPIILTHLDPNLFNNYYFNKPKIHYLKNYSYTEDRTMVDLLKIRGRETL
ncbi:hypothetical protein [Litchfieldia alkalitelluris]|uniref:hypothetical protein n=1 Tax=Litchfieldia alkalitelluris TaxID=304268 RepID=UPI00195DD951|nr:hypothetical protein [Litchfieldia alkalitelluris]